MGPINDFKGCCPFEEIRLSPDEKTILKQFTQPSFLEKIWNLISSSHRCQKEEMVKEILKRCTDLTFSPSRSYLTKMVNNLVINFLTSKSPPSLFDDLDEDAPEINWLDPATSQPGSPISQY